MTHLALRRLGLAFGLLAGAALSPTPATAAVRDFVRKQPGHIENALFENRNPQNKPQFVGGARWKSLKDWKAMFQKEEFQKSSCVRSARWVKSRLAPTAR